MPADDVLGHRQPTLVKAFGAPDAGFLADAPDPLVATGGLIPGLARPAAFESPGINIFPAQEQASEQRDLLIRRRGVGDLWGWWRGVGGGGRWSLHGLECRGPSDAGKIGEGRLWDRSMLLASGFLGRAWGGA
jgi:hypothetical protein